MACVRTTDRVRALYTCCIIYGVQSVYFSSSYTSLLALRLPTRNAQPPHNHKGRGRVNQVRLIHRHRATLAPRPPPGAARQSPRTCRSFCSVPRPHPMGLRRAFLFAIRDQGDPPTPTRNRPGASHASARRCRMVRPCAQPTSDRRPSLRCRPLGDLLCPPSDLHEIGLMAPW